MAKESSVTPEAKKKPYVTPEEKKEPYVTPEILSEEVPPLVLGGCGCGGDGSY